MKNIESNSADMQPGVVSENKKSTTLTILQSLQVGFGAGAASSLINHPFQVLRARFQNNMAMKIQNPSQIPPAILPSDPKILFKGFPATLLSMCCLTVTQAGAKQVFNNQNANNYSNLFAPIVGGFLSAILTTPLEGAIIRQSKTLSGTKISAKTNVFKNSMDFFQEYGLRRLYLGGFLIGIRTSIVGSSFSLWVPMFSDILENKGLTPTASTLISGIFVGTMFAALSQPPETLRIEQQFSADEKPPLTITQGFKQLTAKQGIRGLFKGGIYRIPRTAPGIFINAMVYQGLENHFSEQNKRNSSPTLRHN